MSILNYDCMKLDNSQKRQVPEFIDFKLNQDKEITFQDLNKHCGISILQWQLFCLENKEELGDNLKCF